jgi:hypothetical protein
MSLKEYSKEEFWGNKVIFGNLKCPSVFLLGGGRGLSDGK